MTIEWLRYSPFVVPYDRCYRVLPHPVSPKADVGGLRRSMDGMTYLRALRLTAALVVVTLVVTLVVMGAVCGLSGMP